MMARKGINSARREKERFVSDKERREIARNLELDVKRFVDDGGEIVRVARRRRPAKQTIHANKR